MSLIKTIRQQLGLSVTPANNFTLDASAADGTMKLARGNAGATTQDILTVGTNGVVKTPRNLATFSVRGTATNQAVTAATMAKVQLNLVEFDTINAFDATTNYRYQPNIAGYYQFNGVIRISANAGTMAVWFAELWKNGVTELRGPEINVGGISANGANPSQQICVQGIIYLNGSTDYVELYGYINAVNTSFTNVTPNKSGSCFLQGTLIAPA